ncbi:MAG TPA: hypothetical protein VGH28_09575 [Polyangiaceae bacterium]|jgi:hypothetical protein
MPPYIKALSADQFSGFTSDRASKEFGAFDYVGAARTYAAVARDGSESVDVRRNAATNAAKLDGALGAWNEQATMVALALQLQPSAHERARIEYLPADLEYTHHAGGAKARLEAYFWSHRGNAAAGPMSVEAAWRAAKLENNATDRRAWFERVIQAWRALAAYAPDDSLRSPWVDYGAEAAYEHVEEVAVTKSLRFDCDATKYRRAAANADTIDVMLADVAQRYSTSLAWIPVIRARRAGLHETLRLGKYCPRPIIGQTMLPGIGPMLQRAPPRIARPEQESQEQLVMQELAQALVLANAFDVENGIVRHARSRFAYWAWVLGESTVRSYLNGAVDPLDPHHAAGLRYSPEMLQLIGLPSSMPPNGCAQPAPTAVVGSSRP